jgi:hypothetical protein
MVDTFAGYLAGLQFECVCDFYAGQPISNTFSVTYTHPEMNSGSSNSRRIPMHKEHTTSTVSILARADLTKSNTR